MIVTAGWGVDQPTAIDAGAAYVFTREDAGVWTEQVRLWASEPLATRPIGMAPSGRTCVGISETGVVVASNPSHFRDENLPPGVPYIDGAALIFDASEAIGVAEENGPDIDSDAVELAISPNPVRQLARVTYALARPGVVRLTVHDALGREVALLTDSRQLDGEHVVEWSADRLAAGVYLVRLATETDVQARPLVIAR
ncbi:MAG: hypothetical protein Rubg2KO_25380 [Rubricoccaceae bacterium]